MLRRTLASALTLLLVLPASVALASSAEGDEEEFNPEHDFEVGEWIPIHLGPLGDWLLCDKRYHFIHHSIDPEHHNKNFAERFPVLDMMFGTHHPGGTGTNAVGLADRAPPQRLGEYLTVKLQPRMQAGS